MEPNDFKNHRLLGNGLLKGMGVSAIAHLMFFLLVWVLSLCVPSSKSTPKLYTISLLSLQDAPAGEEGLAPVGKGNSEAGGKPPAGQSVLEQQLGVSDSTQSTEVSVQTPNDVPVTPVLDKPVVKPKPKLKPTQKITEKRQNPAESENIPQAAMTNVDEKPGRSDQLQSGPGEGQWHEGTAGHGMQLTGDGTGGGGHGLLNTSFGSAEGPRFVTKVLPKYPKLARDLGKEGTVLLLLTIDERGHLIDVEVMKHAGLGFDEEALRAVRNSTFSPARRHGKPVICKARLPIFFKLNETDSD